MNTMTNTAVRNMTVEEAAKEMGKSQQFVRIGLQRGFLTFGTAEIMPNSTKYTYYISPDLFYKSIGKELPSKYKDEPKLTKQINHFGIITNVAVANEYFESWRR